jgi:hypothetical protein
MIVSLKVGLCTELTALVMPVGLVLAGCLMHRGYVYSRHRRGFFLTSDHPLWQKQDLRSLQKTGTNEEIDGFVEVSV